MGVRERTLLFSACTFVFDMSHAPNGRLFRVQEGGRIVLRNSSLYSITLAEHGGSGRTDFGRGEFVAVEDQGSSFAATDSVFVRDQSASFFLDKTTNGEGFDLHRCWYARLPFEPEQAPDSAAGIDLSSASVGDEVALDDPAGVYNDFPGMTSPERGDFSAPPSAAIRLLRHPSAMPPISVGINGEPYSGHFGAVQYGWSVCPGDRTGDQVVDGADLGILLSRWLTDDPVADLNADGVVDGADLGLLLANWGPCASP
jgi:hypothetical protein